MTTIKEFDCVVMIRDKRNKIDEEIKEMNNSKIIEFIHADIQEFENKYINKKEYKEVA